MPAASSSCGLFVPPTGARADRRGVLLAAGLIALGVLAVYANSLGGPFTFDDIPSIRDNPTIRQLWPLSGPLSPPPGFGLTVSGRPLLNLSLAINYALGGLDPLGYHLGNALIHLAAALTVFGLVRRTVPRWRPATTPLAATAFGATVALLWSLHPLLTESVTYIVQRAESLMGLFFLLTLYGFGRSLDSENPIRWRRLSVAACLAGAATKEVAAVAPVLLVLYDRTFIAGSLRAVWRERGRFHLALFASWLLLAWLVLGTSADRGGTAGLGVAVDHAGYWRTQFVAVARYLHLTFWPHPLTFEYGYDLVPRLTPILPQVALVGLLAVATLYATWRRTVAGFLGCWFFAVLAPASLTPNTTQVIVEHRMYLPLLAPLTLVTGFCFARWNWRGLVPLAALALVGGGLTVRRNQDYRTDLALWTDSVAKSPRSARAWSNLAAAWFAQGDFSRVLEYSEKSLALDTAHPSAHINYGCALEAFGRYGEAETHFATATRLNPNLPVPLTRRAACLIQLGRFDEVRAPLQRALELDSSDPERHCLLGLLLDHNGLPAAAVAAYRRALTLNPDCDMAESNWGLALTHQDRAAEAVPHFERALALRPGQAAVHEALALALQRLDRTDEAAQQYARTLALAPERAALRIEYGILLAQLGRLPEALAQLESAATALPDSPQARSNLGNVLTELNRLDEAVAQYDAALRLQPGNALAHYNLGNALLRLQRFEEARPHFVTAMRIDPTFTRAREVLDRIEQAFGPAPAP